MLYFRSVGEAENVFKALSTPMRVKIMEMIYEDDSLSMNDLAEALGLTNGAISMHVGKLEEAGLVRIKITSGKRGTMKIVRPRYDRLMIDLAPVKEARRCYTDDIRVGYYTACHATPTCGLATGKEIIGSLDVLLPGPFPGGDPVVHQRICGIQPAKPPAGRPDPVRAADLLRDLFGMSEHQ